MKVSDFITKLLSDKKVKNFYGVQGGAIAHMISSVVKNKKTNYIPVLNEQSAGMYAHGQYLASNDKSCSGILLTTGPGFLNAVTGIATCYYDNIPCVVISGQVSKLLNKSKFFKTKMYGFQEVPHLEISKFISDKSFKIKDISSLKHFYDYIKSQVQIKKVVFVELRDDFSRHFLSKAELKLLNKKTSKKINIKRFKISKNLLNLIYSSKFPLLAVGLGNDTSKKNVDLFNKITKKIKIPCVFTWGGSKFFNSNNSYHIGYFGTHTPGRGNEYLKKCDLLLSVGSSLLQHQSGKIKKDFAENAEILVVNNNNNEKKRYKYEYKNRISFIKADTLNFLNDLAKKYTNKNRSIQISRLKNVDSKPVIFLTKVFNEIKNKDYHIFSDVGTNLSWTYQAANLSKTPNVYTSYNIHTMGYSIPAALGSVYEGKKTLCIIGDGGFMMNCQELVNLHKLSKSKIKIIILDNSGYSIIKQTQDQFFNSKYDGSNVSHKTHDLPNLRIKSICNAMGLNITEGNCEINTNSIRKFLNSKKKNCLIINVGKNERVKF